MLAKLNDDNAYLSAPADVADRMPYLTERLEELPVGASAVINGRVGVACTEAHMFLEKVLTRGGPMWCFILDGAYYKLMACETNDGTYVLSMQSPDGGTNKIFREVEDVTVYMNGPTKGKTWVKDGKIYVDQIEGYEGG